MPKVAAAPLYAKRPSGSRLSRFTILEETSEVEALGGNNLCQVAAFHQLHRQVAESITLLDRVQDDDIGMVERSDRLRLALEALAPIRVVGQLSWENLQGHLAMELVVHRRVDLTHASFAELGEDLVVVDAATDHYSASFSHAGSCSLPLPPCRVRRSIHASWTVLASAGLTHIWS